MSRQYFCIPLLLITVGISQGAAPLAGVSELPGLKCRHRIQAHKDNVRTLVWSPDGKRIATTGDKALRVWDVESGALFRQKCWPNANTIWADWSQKKDLIVCSFGELHCLRVLDADSLKTRHFIKTPPDQSSYSVLFSPDCKRIAVVGSQIVRMISVTNGKQLWSRTTKTTFNSIAFAPNGTTIAVVDFDLDGIRVYDADTGKETNCIAANSDEWHRGVNLLLVTSNSKRVMASFPDSVIRMWNLNTKKQGGEFRWIPQHAPIHQQRLSETPNPGAASMSLSQDNNTLAVMCDDGYLRLFELATGGIRRQYYLGLGDVGFSPTRKPLLATLDYNGVLSIWDWRNPGRKPVPRTITELQRRWKELADDSPQIAYTAMLLLESASAANLQFLETHLKPVPELTQMQLRTLINHLDAETFQEREDASKQIRALGDLAESALRDAAMKPTSLEQANRIRALLSNIGKMPGERMRLIRSIEILENLGTPRAVRLLDRLCTGWSAAKETIVAREARQRLQAKN